LTDNAQFPPLPAQRVLVLAPHPDDESIGCGGTIILHAAAGAQVRILTVTNGESVEGAGDDIAARRQDEARRAAQVLGVPEPVFLGLPDGRVSDYGPELAQRLAQEVAEFGPEVVYAPYPLDVHPDHTATAGAVLRVLEDLGGFRASFYEIYQPIRFSMVVDISEVVAQKRRAIMAHELGLLGAQAIIADAVEGLGLYRSFHNRIRRVYEAFWVVEKAPTEQEILAWSTYGFAIPRAADIFVERLKEVDRLTRESAQALEQAQARNRVLESERAELESLLAATSSELHGVLNSAPWRLVGSFARMRDRLAPAGTARRGFYAGVTNRLKKWLG